MSIFTKKFLSPFLIIAFLIAAFGLGFYYGTQSQPSIEKVTGIQNLEEGKPAAVDFNLFWVAWNEIQDKFVNRAKLDSQKMVYGAISGMLSSLDDPYTVFMTPEENKKFSLDMRGNLEGIGAEVGMRKETLTIISPLENSPAQKAGLKPGDKILKINDKLTAGLTQEEGVSLIRGPKGTEVRLTIFRDGWSSTQEFKIIRDVIIIPIVKLEMKDNGNIAYLSIYQFTDNSAAEFAKAAQQILTSGAKGIVLDVRNNPGGYLESAVEITSWFLPKDAMIVTEDYGDGKKIQHKSSGINKLGSYPLTVLINEGSASASEILAGALRDNKKVKLVGEKSFGKGSVQQLEQLGSGTSLKITVAKWLTPSDHSIMDEGLEPDIKVEITKDDIDENRDPQLDKALEILK